MSEIYGYEINFWQSMLCLKLEDPFTGDIAGAQA